MSIPPFEIEIIATNFKKRLSGVSSTIIQLVPLQNLLGAKLAILGYGLPKRLPYLTLHQFKALWQRPTTRPFYIWHARRHSEMLIGIILRDVLKARLKLIFTSAAQREHKKFTHWLVGKMDGVIATTEKAAANLQRSATIINHGVDLQRFRPAKPAELKNVLPHETAYNIGCFGRIRPSKGTDIFVDSMIALLPQYPDWTAIIAGRATPQYKGYLTQLEQKVKAANLEQRIIFIGEIPNHGEQQDISLLYRELNLYVAPSLSEGFGLTPLEAMASGVAVVASSAGAYPDIIAQDRGIVVDNIDVEKLSSAIKSFFTEPEKTFTMGKKALDFVSKNFGLEHEAKAINDYYETMFQAVPNNKPSLTSCVSH